MTLVCVFSTALLFGQQPQQGPDMRARLASIDYRHARNIDDYISRCKQVEALLPLVDSFYKQADETIQRLRIKHSGDSEFQRLADYYSNLNGLDKDGLKLMHEEMALAEQMSQLPSDKQRGFFDGKIVPLEKMEDRLREREVEMARVAKRNGVALPPDVSQSLNPSK